MRRFTRALAALALVATLPAAGPVAPASAGASHATTARHSGILEKRVIGTSVDGRAITAWHLGDSDVALRADAPSVVLIATMHGNEGAPRQILEALRDGPTVHGVDLWVVPVYNPDGLARGARRNAHGVDLNRNYPYHWVDLDGNYESGSGPGSEPETRAMMRFLGDVRPDFILSFHQPLHGVDTDTKSPAFARRVAQYLHLPRKTLSCGGVCHGTMTGWYNHSFGGVALTVEYGAHPPRRLMRVDAPRQVLEIFGAVASDEDFEPAG